MNDELKFCPYSVHLKELLSDYLRCEVEVDNMGVSGECVVPTMAARLRTVLSACSKRYDWILILGGTNDLSKGVDSDTILATLCSMHDYARAYGARTACLAIPQFALEHEQEFFSLHANKLKVNDGLREYCNRSEGCSAFVDLYHELPHPADGDPERNRYWCDLLHLTELGYSVMANIIFSSLKQQLVMNHSKSLPKL